MVDVLATIVEPPEKWIISNIARKNRADKKGKSDRT
jgi:hypothetical protein